MWEKKNPPLPSRCGRSAPASLFCTTIDSSAQRPIDSRFPEIPNGPPQNASRPRTTLSSVPNDRSGLPQTDAVRRNFVNAQPTMHWRHESRRSEEATTVKLVQTSTPRQRRSRTNQGKRIEGVPVAASSLRACSPVAGTVKAAPATSSIAQSAFHPEPRRRSRQSGGHRDPEKALDASSARDTCRLIKCQHRQGVS